MMSRASSDRHAVNRASVVFSRPLDIDSVPDDGLDVAIEASADECAAIASELDLPAVGALKAEGRVIPLSAGRVQLDGTLTARVTQVCVVSLEPFESGLSQPIEATFAPVTTALPSRHAGKRNEREVLRKAVHPRDIVDVAPGGGADADPPDPIVDGRIDLGAMAVEFLTLALDFYPKKPGVRFDDVLIGEPDAPKPSAFAALERFKDRS